MCIRDSFGSAAEINLSDATAKGDFEGLQALVTDAKAIKKDLSECKHDEFVDDTWNALQDAITTAEASIKAATDDVNAVHDCKVALGKAMLGLRLDGDQPAKITFNDVVADTPHKEDIEWLAANGISTGWENADGTFSFRPYETVRRADMAAFLHRMDKNGLVK